MKKLLPVLTAAVILSASLTPTVSAREDDYDPSDPCAVTLCMFGKATGTADSKCNGAIRHFYSLKSFKNGAFQPHKTLNLRKNLLKKCKSADNDAVGQILQKFGKSR